MNDSGCYLYKSSKKEDNDLRDWFRSTKVHQTMTLNLKNIKRIPKFLLWSNSKDLTALAFENKSYENLTHRRTVLFIKKKYFLIYDEALGNAEGDLRIHYQLVPCEYTFDEKDFSVKTDFAKGANLLVKSFPQSTGMSMHKEKGLISYKQRQKEKRPAWSYMLKKKAAEKEISFLTALVPYKTPQYPALTAKVKKTGNSAIFEFSTEKENYKIKLNWQTKKASIINEKQNDNIYYRIINFFYTSSN